jgi:hypothetical protein
VRRFAPLAPLVALVALAVPSPAAAATPSPSCRLLGAVIALGLLDHDHQTKQAIPLAKVREQWPKVESAAATFPRTPAADAFAAAIRHAGADLRAGRTAAFWADVEGSAAAARAATAHSVCTQGGVTIRQS